VAVQRQRAALLYLTHYASHHRGQQDQQQQPPERLAAPLQRWPTGGVPKKNPLAPCKTTLLKGKTVSIPSSSLPRCGSQISVTHSIFNNALFIENIMTRLECMKQTGQKEQRK
jgi:hypothetical protein